MAAEAFFRTGKKIKKEFKRTYIVKPGKTPKMLDFTIKSNILKVLERLERVGEKRAGLSHTCHSLNFFNLLPEIIKITVAINLVCNVREAVSQHTFPVIFCNAIPFTEHRKRMPTVMWSMSGFSQDPKAVQHSLKILSVFIGADI